MRAIDTNILVYAEMTATPQHRIARNLLSELAAGARPWALPWPCIYEFLRVVTHARVFSPPLSLDVARGDLRNILRSPSLRLLEETDRHFEVLDEILVATRATGNLVHDAHIVALCQEHGVTEFLTADADFLRFPNFNVTNPFRAAAGKKR